ncbi:putative Na+/H+ antiporter, partial [Rhodanobacter sp. 115]
MSSIELVLAMLLAVVASGYLVRVLPFSLPLPLVQIALGAVISGVLKHGVTLDPDVFFLLFLPPLLFLDGWRIPKNGLLRDRAVILELALGLVVFTVLGAGLLIHWLIPSMPLAVAFALAAIVSPTDPVAVSSIAARVPIPTRLMHILEGESLLNDASGLVCFRFAVAAVVTGSFSLLSASLTFLWVALIGLAVGVLFTLLVSYVQQRLSRRFGQESGSSILISLLIPFGAYLLAEKLQASGNPGGGGGRHHHELRGTQRQGAGEHAGPAFGGMGDDPVRAERHRVHAAGRAIAGHSARRGALGGTERSGQSVVAAGVRAGDQRGAGRAALRVGAGVIADEPVACAPSRRGAPETALAAGGG